MKLKVNLAWKIAVGIPGSGADCCQANKYFNFKTGKTFVNKLGGVSSLGFYPNTLDPTNAFYNAIRSHNLENGFIGKKIPFEGTIAGLRKRVKIKIHQFSSSIVVLSISIDQIEFNGTVDDIKNIINIENHAELLSLVKVICSMIISGGKESDPIQRKLKAYPYVEIESYSRDDVVEDKLAVELLTRHNTPKSEIVQSVISKNEDHQLDENSILIDRQGMLARYSLNSIDNNSPNRKFESSHYLFELAISLSHILENNQHSSLTTEQSNSFTKLIETPSIVFTKSVTAYKTWILLLEEFKLRELYNATVENIPQNTQLSVPVDKNEWSEFKKWSMGILGTLVVGLIIWGSSMLYQEFNPLTDKPVRLLQPLDEVQLDINKINFDWVDVEDAKKYILLVEKKNKKDNKWLLLENGGRNVASSSFKVLSINEEGYFKWKVVARNGDEEKMTESTWFFFKIKTPKKIK